MVEIGQAIARAREQKGLPLEHIAEQTRISLKYLHDLEQGNFEFLPRPYVVAYLKEVARIVGLDGEALVRQWREYEETVAAAQKAEREAASASGDQARMATFKPMGSAAPTARFPDTETSATPPPALLPAIPYLKEVLIGLGLVGGMALLLYFSTRSSKQANLLPPAAVQEIPFDQVAQEAAAQQELTPTPALQENATVKHYMRLEIRADDAAWVQVITDNRDTTDYSLRSGNVHAWQALDQFLVRLGNAGAVKILLDGKDLGEIGRPGQVANLIINHDGIKDKRLRGVARRPATTPDTPQVQPDTTRRN